VDFAAISVSKVIADAVVIKRKKGCTDTVTDFATIFIAKFDGNVDAIK